MLEDGAHEDIVAVADVRVQDRDDLGKKRSGRGEGVRQKRRCKKRGKVARTHPEFACRIRDGEDGVPASMEASGMNGSLSQRSRACVECQGNTRRTCACSEACRREACMHAAEVSIGVEVERD
jgi:hypothetical protein